MQEESASPHLRRARQRIAHIRDTILAVDHVCSGTLVTSHTTCGKPTCRCATDPEARHGPYHQWNRMKGGKLVHSTVTIQQAAGLRTAIANYRTVLRLLRKWEEETAKILGVKRRRRRATNGPG